jgi:hypothetical protein
VGFRVLAAGNAPNFRTIAYFRKLHLATLAGLFEEVLQIALEAGALKLGRVALDGTKVQANASKHKAMSYYFGLFQFHLVAHPRNFNRFRDGAGVCDYLDRRTNRCRQRRNLVDI